ncbi:MAG: hypothetical protein M3081_08860, partial [Gemmatimonadota bacterium]|nr:hypothetical protein [Gemmatimonadota bacterium]
MADHSNHAATDAHADPHGEEHHPTWKTYRWIAVILTAITVAEVWIYYVPAITKSRVFVPLLLSLS